MLSLALALLLTVQQGPVPSSNSRPASVPQLYIPPPLERFDYVYPLPSIGGIKVDTYLDEVGLLQQEARAHNLQGRILWIDGTANLDRVNTEEKIVALVHQIADVGFNTIVFDIKPISGQVLYNSKIAPKITEWRGQHLPSDFDPLPIMVREAHANGLQLIVSMNSFSEGHTLLKVGPGYGMPEHQSVLYVPAQYLEAESATVQPSAATTSAPRFRLADTPNTMPASDVELHVFTNPTGYQNNQPGMFTITVGFSGLVLDGFESGGEGRGVPSIPRGGFLVVGQGAAGEWLKTNAPPNSHVHITIQADFVRTAEHPDQYPLMMNPNDPFVQERALSILKEVAASYAVDGIMYDDRLRYAGMDADFSDLSRTMFEQYVKAKLNWPDDVFTFVPPDRGRRTGFSLSGIKYGIKPGQYFDAWMLWRALQMRNWVARVRNTITQANPNISFGIYAGSWYGEYPALGNNYGSSDLDAGFWFLTPPYAKTGFASLLDFIITGCYYTVPTVYDAMLQSKPIGPTVEMAGAMSNRVVDDQCWTYAGLSLESFKGDTNALGNAMEAACASTQGVMIFDLSHNIEPLWPFFKQAFRISSKSPNTARETLANARELRASQIRAGIRKPSLIIAPGAAGAGF